MKNITLKHVVIAAASVTAAVCFTMFLLLYYQDYAEIDETEITGGASSWVITPDNVCSYGEQMFAYIGENNYLYNLDDEETPLVKQAVDMLLYASDDSVLYTSPIEYSADHPGREYQIWELQIGTYENTRNLIATVSLMPVWSSNDEVIYYVEDEEPDSLYSFDPMTSTIELLSVFDGTVTSMRVSSDGLLVTLDDGIEYLYVPLSRQLVEPYYDCQGQRIFICEQYDLILSTEGVLYYRWMGADEAALIAENVVVAEGYQDNEVLYIQQTDESTSLNIYYVSEEETDVLAELEENIFPQLAVSTGYIFVMDRKGIVYRYDFSTYDLSAFCVIDLETVQNPMISVFDYRLMVYDLSGERDNTWCYSCAADATLSEEEENELNLTIHSMPYDTETYEYRTLSMANIGENVYALQNKLLEMGYLEKEPTGIFDYETQLAVQYLQSDLGYPDSGIATDEFITAIMEMDVSETESTLLSAGSSGIRVRDLQARLNALNYLSIIPDGIMGIETMDALSLFAEDENISFATAVSESLNDALYETSESDTRFYTLFAEDANERVTSLNGRLYELGYLTGSVLPDYSEKTEEAIAVFCQVNECEYEEGICSAELQKEIFSEEAVYCPGELKPDTSSEDLSEVEGQVISDRQVKIIRKWLTKQFAINHTDKQAIKRLQKQLVHAGYLSEENVTMIYDQATFDAVLQFQTDNDLDADGIASKNVLMTLFGTTGVTLVE